MERAETRELLQSVADGTWSVDEAVEYLFGGGSIIDIPGRVETGVTRLAPVLGYMPVAVISAYRPDQYGEEKNRRRDLACVRMLRRFGYGCARVWGMWTYPDRSRPLQPGFLIPHVTLSEALRLAGMRERTEAGAIPDQRVMIWGSVKGSAKVLNVEDRATVAEVNWRDFRVFSTAAMTGDDANSISSWQPTSEAGAARTGISFQDLANVQRIRRHWASRGEGLRGDPERLVILEMDRDVRATRYLGLYDDKTTIGVVLKERDEDGDLRVRYLDYENKPRVNALCHFTGWAPLFDMGVGEDDGG